MAKVMNDDGDVSPAKVEGEMKSELTELRIASNSRDIDKTFISSRQDQDENNRVNHYR